MNRYKQPKTNSEKPEKHASPAFWHIYALRLKNGKRKMVLNDSIVWRYLNGGSLDTVRDSWIFKGLGSGNAFEYPVPTNRRRVKRLYEKLDQQILDFQPRSRELVLKLFPDFSQAMDGCTIMLVAGFPDSYDAMVLAHERKVCDIRFDFVRRRIVGGGVFQSPCSDPRIDIYVR